MCNAPVGDGANLKRMADSSDKMLVGAHVSTAGGLEKAIERGTELGCESIQIFNQSPRMWRPTKYGAGECKAFRAAMDDSPIEAVVIHAVYLINCASKDRELRKKSLASLTHALRIGDGIGAAGVVLHPGAQKGEPHGPSMKRAAKLIAAALEDSDSCPLLLEQTAGHKGLLGRDFDETAELIELAGSGRRLGLCLDSCHLFVQGYDVTDPDSLTQIVDEADEKVGLDRHANISQGEMGKQGLAAFLSEPRFEGLPATLETPGPNKKGPDRKEVTAAKRLRKAGLKRRKA